MFCNGKWCAAVFMLGKKVAVHHQSRVTKVNFVYYCNGIMSQTISEMIALVICCSSKMGRDSTHLITCCFILMRTPPLLLPEKWPPKSPDLNTIDYGQCWKRKCAKRRSATLITLRINWERQWQLFHKSTSPALSFILQPCTGLYYCWRRAFRM